MLARAASTGIDFSNAKKAAKETSTMQSILTAKTAPTAVQKGSLKLTGTLVWIRLAKTQTGVCNVTLQNIWIKSTPVRIGVICSDK